MILNFYFGMDEEKKLYGNLKHTPLVRKFVNEEYYYLGDLGREVLFIYEPREIEKQKYYNKIIKEDEKIFCLSPWKKLFFEDLIQKWSKRFYKLNDEYNPSIGNIVLVEKQSLLDMKIN